MIYYKETRKDINILSGKVVLDTKNLGIQNAYILNNYNKEDGIML